MQQDGTGGVDVAQGKAWAGDLGLPSAGQRRRQTARQGGFSAAQRAAQIQGAKPLPQRAPGVDQFFADNPAQGFRFPGIIQQPGHMMTPSVEVCPQLIRRA